MIIVGLAAYHNSFKGSFHLDDKPRIFEEPQIRHFWPPWQVMAHSSRPVVQLSLAMNYAIGGLNQWGYHAVNLALHISAGLALFGVVRHMLESEKLRRRYGRVAPWLALAVAGIWLVHPLQTESVTYIIQRAETLMGLFLLLTLYCVIRGAQSRHPRAWDAIAVIACSLGMGSKEVMVAAPLVIVLYDWVFITGSFAGIFRQRARLYAGLAGTWLVLGILLMTNRSEQQIVMVTGLTPWRYALTQFGVIVHYLRLAVWPRPLVFDYGWPLAESVTSALPWAVLVSALLAGTALTLLRKTWVGFWGAWFFLLLAPTSSILPIADVAFEHRMYLPLAAVVLCVTISGYALVETALTRLAAPADLRFWLEASLVVVAVAALGAATVRRNEDYRSEVALWSDTVAKRPDNARAHNNLAVALKRQDKVEEAIAHFAEALRLKPDYADAHSNLAFALLDRGRTEEAAAHYAEVVRLRPTSSDARNDLGAARYRQGRIEEAIALYSEALRLKPTSAEAHHNLGLALAKQGNITEAIAHYSAALRLKPAYAQAHVNLGAALLKQGRVAEEITHYSEAVRLRPDDADAHNNLGVALYRQGRITEAIGQFSEAVRLQPDFVRARENLRSAQPSR